MISNTLSGLEDSSQGEEENSTKDSSSFFTESTELLLSVDPAVNPDKSSKAENKYTSEESIHSNFGPNEISETCKESLTPETRFKSDSVSEHHETSNSLIGNESFDESSRSQYDDDEQNDSDEERNQHSSPWHSFQVV